VGETFDPLLLKEALVDSSSNSASIQSSAAESSAENSVASSTDEESAVVPQESLASEVAAVVSNEALAAEGAAMANDALSRYLRAAFPYLPEEGVDAFVAHLTSTEVMADVAFHIGLKDLIKCEVRKESVVCQNKLEEITIP